MDLSHICEVAQCITETQANAYLSLGWVLLGEISSRTSDGKDGFEHYHSYSLGWDRNNGEPVHPEYLGG